MTQINPASPLDIIFVPARIDKPLGTIVLLHGWGANNEDLGDLVPYFKLPEYQFLFVWWIK